MTVVPSDLIHWVRSRPHNGYLYQPVRRSIGPSFKMVSSSSQSSSPSPSTSIASFAAILYDLYMHMSVYLSHFRPAITLCHGADDEMISLLEKLLIEDTFLDISFGVRVGGQYQS